MSLSRFRLTITLGTLFAACASAEARAAPPAASPSEGAGISPDTVPQASPVRWQAPFAVESSGELAPREPRPPVVRLERDPTRRAAARPAVDTAATASARPDTTAAAAARRAAARVAAGSRPAARDTAAAKPPKRESAGVAREPRTHTVGRGDTLLGIARKYGVTPERIRAANRLKSDQVNLGQKLVIPRPE